MNRNNWLWTGVIVLILVVGGWSVVQERNSEPVAPIEIGSLIPLTGRLASYGEDMQNALILAEEELNKAGGNFDIIFEDSAGEAKTGLSGARKLIDIDSVPIVIGGPGSSSNLAAAPVFEEEKILFFPISNTPKLNTAGDYIFKANPDIDFEVKRMLPHLRAQGVKRVAVFYDSSTDTNTAAAMFFRDGFKEPGESVVAFEGIDSKTTNDFRTQLTNVKQLAPDALYIFMNARLSGLLVRQAQELGAASRVFSWSALSDPEFFTSAGKSAEGVVITDQPFSCDGTTPMREFCDAYRKRFSERTPTLYGAAAYDILRVLSGVLQNSGSIGEAETKRIQQAFTGHTYHGVSGQLMFDEQGNIRDKDFVFRIAKSGKFVDLK